MSSRLLSRFRNQSFAKLALNGQVQVGIQRWSGRRGTLRFHVLEFRPFSALAAGSSASSILDRCGISPGWLEERRLVLKDDDGKLFTEMLDMEKKTFRLLFVKPASSPDSRIETFLFQCSLEDCPPYLALSYTGRNPFPKDRRKKGDNGSEKLYSKRKNVLVNGVEFPVKFNLFQALLRLRDTHPMKLLYVDSICINESDPVERSEQVRLMGKIYGRSDEALIWLGEIENRFETKAALELVKNVFEKFVSWYDDNHETGFRKRWEQINRTTGTTPDSIDQKHFWEWLQSDCEPFFDRIDFKSLGIRTDRRAWDGVAKLLSRTWFDRVWCWQEKEVAKKAIVYIGDLSIPWDVLRFAMLIIMEHDLSENRVTAFPVLPGQQYLHVLDSLNIADSPDLLDIVINVRHRDSELARDKIFGVLGAAEAYNNPKDIEYFSRLVNYGDMRTEGLYKEFSRYWIEDRHDLRVLQACNPGKKQTEGLPTWVADWTDITLSYQLSTSRYRASKDTQVEVDHEWHRNSDQLKLKGIPIDKIKFICHDKRLDEIEEKYINESADWDPYRQELIQRFALMYTAGHWGKRISEMLRGNWLQAAQHIGWGRKYEPTGQSMGEAYWRTLLVDHNPHIKRASNQRIPADTDVCSIFHRWAYSRGLNRGFRPREDHEKRPKKDHENIGMGLGRWTERLERSLLYKRFFVTEKGFIGLAPSNALAGDVVCVFLGGQVPFSVRKADDHYTLVEETYLHGFMDGRAVDLANQGHLESVDFILQ